MTLPADFIEIEQNMAELRPIFPMQVDFGHDFSFRNLFHQNDDIG
jgi:hypothetical protein